jgi:hypothetical protein
MTNVLMKEQICSPMVAEVRCAGEISVTFE